MSTNTEPPAAPSTVPPTAVEDDDLATRAPESDAQEDVAAPSAASNETAEGGRVDQGAASMGEHCTTDRPTPEGLSPTGELSKLDDIAVYIAKPADYPHTPGKLLLLLTPGTGILSTNNQLQADKYASEGFLVVMPDQFDGYPAPNSNNPAPPATNPSFIEQIKLGVADVAKLFTIDMWLAYHTPEKVLPRLQRVVRAARQEFADAVASADGIYAVGYCFGAKYALLLGSESAPAPEFKKSDAEAAAAQSEAEEGKALPPTPEAPLIRAAAIAHGTQISKADFARVAVPTAVLAVENDPLFPDDVREAGLQALKANGVECEDTVYAGVPHGFAVLGDYADDEIVRKQGEAYAQILAWLKAH